jgi:hypothetical protein
MSDREAFEKWAEDKSFILCVSSGAGYINVKEMAREAWQAAQAQAVNQQLLEALEAVLECGSTTDQWWVDQARAAIAAAQEQGK